MGLEENIEKKLKIVATNTSCSYSNKIGYFFSPENESNRKEVIRCVELYAVEPVLLEIVMRILGQMIAWTSPKDIARITGAFQNKVVVDVVNKYAKHESAKPILDSFMSYMRWTAYWEKKNSLAAVGLLSKELLKDDIMKQLDEVKEQDLPDTVHQIGRQAYRALIKHD